MKQTIRQKGHNVTKMRVNAGMNQRALSEKAGVCRAVICTLEQGKPVKVETASKVAQALGREINELFEIKTI